jgi:pimeloyl-ACP methyl ester carboxylesterase
VRPHGEHRSWIADVTFRGQRRQRPGRIVLPLLGHDWRDVLTPTQGFWPPLSLHYLGPAWPWPESSFEPLHPLGLSPYALALLDRLEIDRAIFVGASQGGFVSLRAALLAPDRVRGLGLMGTSAATEDPMQKAAHEQLHAALFSADGPPEALLDMLVQSFFGQRFDPGPWREHLRGQPEDQANYSFRALVDRDEVATKLNRITAPTLVLHGSADAYYAPSIGEEIANGVADCRGFVLVEGGSHLLSMTHPEPTNAALGDFFESLA